MKDHPRSCGEQEQYWVKLQAGAGSPPLMRGTVADRSLVEWYYRITPAHAGNRYDAP